MKQADLPLISVIVPVYRVEKYLERCVESILTQTYKNLEIILVDDGSDDACPAICDEYARQDKRIVVIHKKNGGLVSARKAGIQKASGGLIGYVDSDDWVEADMYELMQRKMAEHDADIVVAGHIEYRLDGEIYPIVCSVPPGAYRGEDLEKTLYPKMIHDREIKRWGVCPSACTKLFKRDVVFAHQMDVDDRIWSGEDTAFVYPSLLSANCVSVMEDLVYHQCYREGSVSWAPDPICFERISVLQNSFKEKLMATPYWPDTLEEQYYHRMRIYIARHANTEFDLHKFGYVNVSSPFIFPFGKVAPGSRIVLYAAGSAGQAFYTQLAATKYCEVVCWVDMDWEKYKELGMPVESAEKVREVEFDRIVIAAIEEKTSQSILTDLAAMGIDREKTVWVQPRMERGW